MKIHMLYLVAIAAVASLAIAGCFFDTITGPIVTVNQNQGQGNGPGTGVSPSPGPTGVITSVRVSVFDPESCPDGSTPNPAPLIVALNCVQPITCTPLLANGDKAPESLHPPAPDSFDVVSGSAVSLRLQGNPYNRDAVGVATGVSKIRCTVGSATPGELELTVQ